MAVNQTLTVSFALWKRVFQEQRYKAFAFFETTQDTWHMLRMKNL